MSDANFKVVSYVSYPGYVPKYVYLYSLKRTLGLHQENCLCPTEHPTECYVPINRMTHCTQFDKAAQIIEDGQFRAFSMGDKPCIFGRDMRNPGSPIDPDEAHYLFDKDLFWMGLNSPAKQPYAPAYGNVCFDMRFPVESIANGRIKLYIADYAEWKNSTICRVLLTKRTLDRKDYPYLVRVTPGKIGGAITILDGQAYAMTKIRQFNATPNLYVPLILELMVMGDEAPLMSSLYSKCSGLRALFPSFKSTKTAGGQFVINYEDDSGLKSAALSYIELLDECKRGEMGGVLAELPFRNPTMTAQFKKNNNYLEEELQE